MNFTEETIEGLESISKLLMHMIAEASAEEDKEILDELFVHSRATKRAINLIKILSEQLHKDGWIPITMQLPGSYREGTDEKNNDIPTA